jgi:hypothetical protein
MSVITGPAVFSARVPLEPARVAVLASLLAAVCFAQLSTTATITGTVTDSSGAVIPGVTVTITNQDTNAVTSTQTNSTGIFIAPGLSIGSYTVTVAASGFQTYKESNIVLHPAMTATVNLVLRPGKLGTEVSVSASAAEVQTTTDEVSSDVSETQIATLPLNGRNYQGLAAVMPGVVNRAAGSALGQGGRATSNVLTVNGMAQSTTFYALDGIWDENTGNMNQNSIVPNPDTLEEVRVLQNNYSPKYSLMGASVVLLQTKSGTSRFHGSAFDYFRNDDLNSRNFFSKSVPMLKQNIFGYTVGGPLYIPGHYNQSKEKTFFFLSEQWVVAHVGSVLQGATPTAQERAGLFAGVVKNPLTGQPFPQNAAGQYQIPASMLNAASLAYLNALYPLPNNAGNGFNNYLNTAPQITDQRDDEIKIDHNFTSNIRLTGEYFDERQTLRSSSTLSAPAGAGSPFPNTYENDVTQNQMAQLQLTTILSPAMVNTVSVASNIYVLNLNLAGIYNTSQIPGFHETLPFNGFLSNRLPLVTISQGWSAAGIPAARPLVHAGDLDDTLSDDWSWLHGKHYFQAGINLVLNTKRQNAPAASNGQWTFTGQFTGNAMADFLLGDAATFTQQSTELRPYIHGEIVSPYFEDRIKVNRRLTLRLGARLSFMPLPFPQPGYETMFEPSRYNRANAPIVNTNGTITPTATYNPLNGLVPNGVGGVPQNWYTNNQWFLGPSAGFAWDVFGDGITSVRGGYGITYSRIFTNQDCSYSCALNPPFVQSVNLVNPQFPSPVGTGTAKAPSAPTLSMADANIKPTQIETYSLSLEHEFAGKWLVSVAGAGAEAHHLPATWNYNQPLPDEAYNFNPILNTGNVFNYIYSPYQGYAAINAINTNENSNWNALEISMRHPVGNNLFLSLAYTWSHSLSNETVVDIYHPNAYYGPPATNVGQMFSVSMVYNLPFFQASHGLRGALLGGWKLSDITTARSGFSLTPGLSVAHQGLGARPNVVSGLPVTGPQTASEWFNTGAFAAPAPGYFGDAGTGIITGPGLLDFDMALYKDFQVTEHDTFEFRSEFFNIFNHTNFSGVSLNYGAGNFGQVTSALDPRIIELVLRFQF